MAPDGTAASGRPHHSPYFRLVLPYLASLPVAAVAVAVVSSASDPKIEVLLIMWLGWLFVALLAGGQGRSPGSSSWWPVRRCGRCRRLTSSTAPWWWRCYRGSSTWSVEFGFLR